MLIGNCLVPFFWGAAAQRGVMEGGGREEKGQVGKPRLNGGGMGVEPALQFEDIYRRATGVVFRVLVLRCAWGPVSRRSVGGVPCTTKLFASLLFHDESRKANRRSSPVSR